MNAPGTIVDGDAVRFERLVPGPIERVWSFLTESERLAVWFCAGSVASVVGGEVRFDMGASGRITAYEPPHVLEYTWSDPERSHGPVFDSLVRWELTPEGDRVRLLLVHRRLTGMTGFSQFGAGWHAVLDSLDAHLQGREAPSIEANFTILEPIYQARFSV